MPLQQSLRHLDRAFKDFFRGRSRFPRFKSRRARQSAHYMRNAFTLKESGVRGKPLVLLAKMDAPLRIRWSRRLPSDPERRIEVSWNRQKGATRPVKIRVFSVDQKGILAAITKVITKCEANILRASVYSTGDGRGIHSFEVDIQNVQHLNRVLEAVQKIKGVMQVERVKFGRKG